MTGRMQDEILFNRALHALANVCEFQLIDETIEIYDKVLSPIGYGLAAKAISKLMATRKTNDRFPSAADILSCAHDRLSDSAASTEMAETIWRAVAIFGKYQIPAARRYLGELAWKTAGDSEGWLTLCEQNSTAATSIKAQLRDRAKGVLESARNQDVNTLLGFQNRPLLDDLQKTGKEVASGQS